MSKLTGNLNREDLKASRLPLGPDVIYFRVFVVAISYITFNKPDTPYFNINRTYSINV